MPGFTLLIGDNSENNREDIFFGAFWGVLLEIFFL
jgi:hypothetical protein